MGYHATEAVRVKSRKIQTYHYQYGRNIDMKRLVMLALGVAMPGAILALMFPMTKARAADKQPRFSQLKMEQLNDQQRPVAEEILKVSSIGLTGPYNLMLRSPVLAERMLKLLDY